MKDEVLGGGGLCCPATNVSWIKGSAVLVPAREGGRKGFSKQADRRASVHRRTAEGRKSRRPETYYKVKQALPPHGAHAMEGCMYVLLRFMVLSEMYTAVAGVLPTPS